MKKRLLAWLLAISCMTTNLVLVAAEENATQADGATVTTEAIDPATPNRNYLINLDFDQMTTKDFEQIKDISITRNDGEVKVIDFSEIDPESTWGNVLALTYDGSTMNYTCCPMVLIPLGRTIKRGKVTLELNTAFSKAQNQQIGFSYEGATAFSPEFGGRATRVGGVSATSQFFAQPMDWMKISMTLDYDTRSFTMYVDDVMIVENEEWTTTVNPIDAVRFMTWPGEGKPSSIYVNDLQCYLEDTVVEGEGVQEETIYTKPEAVLKGLNVLRETDRYSLSAPVTRGRFAQLIARSMGMLEENIDSYYDEEYADVNEDNIYRRPIGYLTALGWVNSADGNFYPDAPITFEQAAKWMCYLVGYELVAERHGGWPQGYITVLSSLGILDDMYLTNATVLTEGDAILMLIRLLETDVYKTVIYGVKSTRQVTKGYSAMEEYFDCHKVEGIVTATDKTGITTLAGAVGPNQIAIDNTSFVLNYSTGADLIGKSVTAYYVDNTDLAVKEIIYIEIDKRKNNQLVIYDEDIVSVTNLSDAYELQYLDENDKLEKVTIPKNKYFIYNGIAYGDVIPASYLQPKVGELTLTDNNRDGNYDIISIQNHTYVAVRSYDSVSNKIYGQNDEIILLDQRAYLWNGKKEIDYTALAAWDVLQVTRNSRGDVTMLLLENMVQGVVETIGDGTVVIDGVTYPLSPYLDAAALANFTVGVDIQVFLDPRGRVCAIDESKIGQLEPGYLIGVEKANAFGGLRMLILTKEGSAKVFNVSENVRYNDQKLSAISSVPTIDLVAGGLSGVTESLSGLSNYDRLMKLLKVDSFKKQIATRTAEDIQTNIGNGNIKADVIRQVISYRLRDGETITTIDTNYFQLDKTRRFGSSATYKKTGRLFVNFAVAKEKQLCFVVPGEESTNVNDYSIVDWDNYNPSGSIYPEAYNMSAAQVPELMVIYGDVTYAVSDEADPLIVENVYKTVNSEGDPALSIELYERGKKTTYRTTSELAEEDIRPGDIIGIRRNAKGEIAVWAKRIRVSENPDFIYDTDYGAWTQLNYGVLAGVDEYALSIAATNETGGTPTAPIIGAGIPFAMKDNAKVYLYDLTTNKLHLGTVNDIANYTFDLRPDARVAVRTNVSSLEEVFIFFAS